MVQTMGFGVYVQYSLCVPLFSILSMRVAVLVVFITVYNDISLPSSLHCSRIVEYSKYITLGERKGGKR